jgi:hypothetical protein
MFINSKAKHNAVQRFALSNTTIGTLLALMSNTIVIILLPAIFNGIRINPPSPSTSNTLWILMGYSLITASLLIILDSH